MTRGEIVLWIIAFILLVLISGVKQAEARTVKVCTPDLKRCTTIKLPTSGCRHIMGYKICR